MTLHAGTFTQTNFAPKTVHFNCTLQLLKLYANQPIHGEKSTQKTRHAEKSIRKTRHAEKSTRKTRHQFRGQYSVVTPKP